MHWIVIKLINEKGNNFLDSLLEGPKIDTP